MYLPYIVELYTLIFLFLEQYLLERYIDVLINRELKFFEEVDSLVIEDCMMEQEEVLPVAPIEEATIESIKVVEPELSMLGEDQEELLNELTMTFSYDNILTIHDAAEQDSFDFESSYTKFATAKIADKLDGPQQWIVKVIGIEGTYIHVTDGSRIWVDVGEDVYRLQQNCVMSVDIERAGEDITVHRMSLLETGITEDYLIPDEVQYLEEDVQMVI